MDRVYLSGKISGVPVEDYTARFAAAEEWLKGQGYEVVNPVTDGVIQETWRKLGYRATLAACMKRLLYCDKIYMLANYKYSKGALAELAFADATGLEIMYEERAWQDFGNRDKSISV